MLPRTGGTKQMARYQFTRDLARWRLAGYWTALMALLMFASWWWPL